MAHALRAQEAYDAKYPAAAGPVGHVAHNVGHAAQHQHAAAAPDDEAERRLRLSSYVDAMQNGARPLAAPAARSPPSLMHMLHRLVIGPFPRSHA